MVGRVAVSYSPISAVVGRVAASFDRRAANNAYQSESGTRWDRAGTGLHALSMFYICVRDWAVISLHIEITFERCSRRSKCWASCDRFWTRRGLCCSNGSTPSDAEPIAVVRGMYHCWILSALHMIRRRSRSGGESMGNRRVLTRDVSHSNCSAACAVQWSA